jgi:hypothetical protein
MSDFPNTSSGRARRLRSVAPQRPTAASAQGPGRHATDLADRSPVPIGTVNHHATVGGGGSHRANTQSGFPADDSRPPGPAVAGPGVIAARPVRLGRAVLAYALDRTDSGSIPSLRGWRSCQRWSALGPRTIMRWRPPGLRLVPPRSRTDPCPARAVAHVSPPAGVFRRSGFCQRAGSVC